MSKRNEMLKGNVPSWKTEDWDEYITNYGWVQIKCGRVVGCNVRLSKTHTGMALVVKIDNGQFTCLQERRFYPEAELASSGYLYKDKNLNSMPAWEVLEMIGRDHTEGYAARKVKKELVRLLQKNVKLRKTDLNDLLKEWRNPIKKG